MPWKPMLMTAERVSLTEWATQRTIVQRDCFVAALPATTTSRRHCEPPGTLWGGKAKRIPPSPEQVFVRLIRRCRPLAPTLSPSAPSAGRGRDPREAWEGEGLAPREPT